MTSPSAGAPPAGAGEVTRLLAAAREGTPEAAERLFSLLYQELQHVARRHVAGAGDGVGPSATSVVHEAFLRLVRHTAFPYQDRVHFFAVASKAMRQIVIDRVRARQATKRGGDHYHDELDEVRFAAPSSEASPAELLALDVALGGLERRAPRLAQVVEWHFFGGLSFAEIAGALELSERTVLRDWRTARALLHAELAGG